MALLLETLVIFLESVVQPWQSALRRKPPLCLTVGKINVCIKISTLCQLVLILMTYS